MKNIFFNADNKIRNGWWIVLFIGLIVATQPLYRLLTGALKALNTPPWLVEATSVFLVLGVTVICVQLKRQTMAQVGLAGNVRWLSEFFGGVAGGATWLLLVALPLWLMGGVSFDVNPDATAKLVGYGFYTFFLGALLEELLHRGFIFQRLIDGTGFMVAQIIMAMVFALGHLGNPEMDGLTAVRASLDLVLASLIFGLAYWRTRSLALPTGLHLGWNWMQGSVLGFNVSGHETGGYFKATLADLPDWVSGGQFGLEGSILSLLGSTIVLVLLWRWRGLQSQPYNAATPPVSQIAQP
ncbi:type II CAAX endopeptidase family protein [Simiduia curdlanivorans]|uniref:CPBP family intramembrane glutamic endopeptidase n=1 Tax=Simiduia curdlanivorans TaxID=1492769 RepID=A0ABV8VB39_9GAMM|nr:type II CAAX endopeptidase family protein [Simiduia curdlanivorans]MDN3639380.1 type II CAAX endopeptidase family protein [Simiduia curdlanivorans]